MDALVHKLSLKFLLIQITYKNFYIILLTIYFPYEIIRFAMQELQYILLELVKLWKNLLKEV
jgi:hypothetical protein